MTRLGFDCPDGATTRGPCAPDQYGVSSLSNCGVPRLSGSCCRPRWFPPDRALDIIVCDVWHVRFACFSWAATGCPVQQGIGREKCGRKSNQVLRGQEPTSLRKSLQEIAMPTRRGFLKQMAQHGVATVLPAPAIDSQAGEPPGIEVNDVQSQLNWTRVRQVIIPRSLEAMQAGLRDAARDGRAVSVAGGRHAMGGQQFGTDTLLFDMKSCKRILHFDRAKGHIEVEAGIEWPE